jgi:hypothetical protein
MKQVLFFAALIAAASSAANADPRDEALAAMQHCSALPDRDRRLDCFDVAMSRAPVMQDPTLMHPISALPNGKGPVVTVGVPPSHH